jgi:hypothetical protein
MKLIVVHNAAGSLVSVGRVRRDDVRRGFGILPSPGHCVLEVDVTGPIAEKPFIDIHNHCVVDVKTKTLVLRSDRWGSPGRRPGVSGACGAAGQ